MSGPGVDLSDLRQVNFAVTVNGPQYEQVPRDARWLTVQQDDELRKRWREVVFDVERVSLKDLKYDLQRAQFVFWYSSICLRNGEVYLYLVFSRGVRENSKVDTAKWFTGVAPTLTVSIDQNSILWVEMGHPNMEVKPEGTIRFHPDETIRYYPRQ